MALGNGGGVRPRRTAPWREAASASRFRIRIWAVVVWLVAWQAAAMLMDSRLLLPAPVEVLARFFSLAATYGFWGRVAFTLLRILAGFCLGVTLGAGLAAVAMRFRRAGELFAPAMALAKSVPVACFVVLALIWAGASELSVVVSVLVVAPIVYENVCDGVRATDALLLEMADVLCVPAMRRLTAIYLPQTVPYFRAACASSLGMAWKAGVAAEIIAIPAGSIGEALYGAKIYFDTTDLFAWTLAVVVLSVLFEKAFSWAITRAGDAFGGGARPNRQESEAAAGDASLMRGADCSGASGGGSASGGETAAPAASDGRSPVDDGGISTGAGLGPRSDDGASLSAASRPGSDGALEFRGVSKSFGGARAFSGVSFRASCGEPVCLMAPSGFGKTTLLRMAAGLETPDEGEVAFARAGSDGMAVRERNGAAEVRVSMAFQDDRLIEHLDALSNARLALHSHEEGWAQAESLLDRLGVADCIGRPARACSGGQRRRIALARALLTPHDVLLLDEPFAGLDDASRAAAALVVRDRERGTGGIMVVATHDPRDASLLDARIVRL